MLPKNRLPWLNRLLDLTHSAPKSESSKLIINKSAYRLREDLQIPCVATIANEILQLKQELSGKGLKFTSWMGDFTSCNEDAEMGKLWENAWILAHAGIKSGTRVLDAGGASSIFSFYLASKGCEVSVIDMDWLNQGIIDNAISVARTMHWRMHITSGDITAPLPYPKNYFDSVFCICVMEHLFPKQRQVAVSRLAACLKRGGVMGLTIDYDADRGGDKGLRFRDLASIYNDLIRPSRLKVYGNTILADEYDERFFLGALFLSKSYLGIRKQASRHLLVK